MGVLYIYTNLRDVLEISTPVIALFLLITLVTTVNMIVFLIKPRFPNQLIAVLLGAFNIAAGQIYKNHRKRAIFFYLVFVGAFIGLVVIPNHSVVASIIMIAYIGSFIDVCFSNYRRKRKKFRGAAGSVGLGDDRGYDVLDQVMDDMDRQFQDDSASYSDQNNW
ncbi:hypothetical protein [Halalkalibacter okhensis]|uniref:Uncharacterized protein n=1 Tax=Halalkalibacter okhensis TaxID=333138 RepID=A0A0B0I946_9BACI|nr:hypothetical protein [Halalkalibacter okhensis]KHF37785.1 hypothetical protein LQ50_25405 [Halalkalibacter okhensis]